MARPRIVRRAIRITAEQDDWLKKKVREMRQQVPPGEVVRVNDSSIIQGLLDWWISLEKANEAVVPPHKGDDLEGGPEETRRTPRREERKRPPKQGRPVR